MKREKARGRREITHEVSKRRNHSTSNYEFDWCQVYWCIGVVKLCFVVIVVFSLVVAYHVTKRQHTAQEDDVDLNDIPSTPNNNNTLSLLPWEQPERDWFPMPPFYALPSKPCAPSPPNCDDVTWSTNKVLNAILTPPSLVRCRLHYSNQSEKQYTVMDDVLDIPTIKDGPCIVPLFNQMDGREEEGKEASRPLLTVGINGRSPSSIRGGCCMRDSIMPNICPVGKSPFSSFPLFYLPFSPIRFATFSLTFLYVFQVL